MHLRGVRHLGSFELEFDVARERLGKMSIEQWSPDEGGMPLLL